MSKRNALNSRKKTSVFEWGATVVTRGYASRCHRPGICSARVEDIVKVGPILRMSVWHVYDTHRMSLMGMYSHCAIAVSAVSRKCRIGKNRRRSAFCASDFLPRIADQIPQVRMMNDARPTA